jgi:hypothetical protein
MPRKLAMSAIMAAYSAVFIVFAELQAAVLKTTI